MKIAVPRERDQEERRVALIPDHVEQLVQKGIQVTVEASAGAGAGCPDEAYRSAGAEVSSQRESMLAAADLVVGVRILPAEDVARLGEGCLSISFLDPFQASELIELLSSRGISAVSMELIPRSTRAQKMDALSSQASLAGYVAVILAAEALDKIFPMMTTPAGTILPARVFVLGAGVAGLQAIATAKRLGARVEAYDTRPVVEEQVKSLGARFVKIELGSTGETRQGYARALSKEQLGLQQEALAAVCAQSDVVITTAQVFGRQAPRLITGQTLSRMRPGSVVVDLAVERGGNVEGSEVDRIVETGGVRIIGLANLPGRVAAHASQMYSSNLFHLIEECLHEGEPRLNLDLNHEVLGACLVTHRGRILYEGINPSVNR
ncbi:MAG: Re/Si-specific NAD(P)(+) transhydrogenase subunit alpha [Acidobacteriota bacterium]|nr:Re/Si-specific NAD(P)(+) transhydrogenase subunit alpha [Acidobacteriota bacterium]